MTKLAAAEYEHRVNLYRNLFDTFVTSKGTKRVGRSCLSRFHKSQTVLSCESAAGLGALQGPNLDHGHHPNIP